MGRSITLWPVVVVALLAPCAAVAQMRPRPYPPLEAREPMPEGQRLTAADGDTVVVEGDARVRIVRRRAAVVRLIADKERRTALVIAEFLRAAGDTPTQRGNTSYSYSALDGAWPLPLRWEGEAWLEETQLSGDPMMRGPGSLTIETPDATLMFSNEATPSPRAGTVVLRYQGLGIGGGAGSFDETERMVVGMARRSPGLIGSGGMAAVGSWVEANPVGPGAPPPPANGALRPGGVVRPPRLIRRVDPQLPEAAYKAGIQGIVILEITVGPNGSVTDARVLRSIPLLDEEALRAVRQWRYEPTQLNGAAVPVILTVTVPFTR